MKQESKRWLSRALIVAALLGVGVLVWQVSRPTGLGEGFASGNGRIEATEVDVAAKLPGRVAEIKVDEGDFVKAGEIVARMDTQVLEAQLAQAQAQVRQAENAKLTATSLVAQREREEHRPGRGGAAPGRADSGAEALHPYRGAGQAQCPAATATRRRSGDPAERPGGVVRGTLASDFGAGGDRGRAFPGNRGAVGHRGGQGQRRPAPGGYRRQPAQGAAQRPRAVPRGTAGEVLPAGGKLLNMVDLADVYMTFFLPSMQAGRVGLGQEVRLVIDAVPDYVIPAKVSYVASVAQFTPKTVETANEREKLMFRVKARLDPALLEKYITYVKTGVPGMAYLRLDPEVEWPANLQIKVPQ